MGVIKDLTGLRFGKLTAIKLSGRDSKGRLMWLCRCDCGNEKAIRATSLAQGLTKSCGCIYHMQSKTRLYGIWCHMIQRCEDQHSNNYRLYGERGISVCEEWRHDFMAFRAWSLENGYSEVLTIDRINTDGNYEPSNCRWATVSQQNSNRRHYSLKNKRVYKKVVTL